MFGIVLLALKVTYWRMTFVLIICLCVVGNGDRTCFWNDKWRSDAPLIDLCPNLYAVEKKKDRLVSNKAVFENGVLIQWNWDWIR